MARLWSLFSHNYFLPPCLFSTHQKDYFVHKANSHTGLGPPLFAGSRQVHCRRFLLFLPKYCSYLSHYFPAKSQWQKKLDFFSVSAFGQHSREKHIKPAKVKCQQIFLNRDPSNMIWSRFTKYYYHHRITTPFQTYSYLPPPNIIINCIIKTRCRRIKRYATWIIWSNEIFQFLYHVTMRKTRAFYYNIYVRVYRKYVSSSFFAYVLS